MGHTLYILCYKEGFYNWTPFCVGYQFLSIKHSITTDVGAGLGSMGRKSKPILRKIVYSYENNFIFFKERISVRLIGLLKE